MRAVAAAPADHQRALHAAVELDKTARDVPEAGLAFVMDDIKGLVVSMPPAGGKHRSAPEESPAVFIRAGQQRFYARHGLAAGARVDVGNCGARDLLALAHGMVLSFASESDTGANPVVLRVHAPAHARRHPNHWWYQSNSNVKAGVVERPLSDVLRRPVPEDRLHDDDEKSSDANSTTATTSKTATKTVMFADSMGSNTSGNGPETQKLSDNVDEGYDAEETVDDQGRAITGQKTISVLANHDFSSLLWDPKDEGFELHDADGKVLFVVDPSCRNLVVGGGAQCEGSISLPWLGPDDVAAVFRCVQDSSECYLVTHRRIKAKSSCCRITLELPPHVAFPLKNEDRLLFGTSCLVFRQENPRRNVSPTEQGNPHQFFDSLSVQVTSRQRGPGSTLLESSRMFVMPSRASFCIGSSEEADICVKGANMSRKHLLFHRREKLYELECKTKRCTYLLLGCGTHYYRPAVLLRSKDVFTAGRTSFKIIYQSRRETPMESMTSKAEILQTSGVDKSRSKTRLLDGSDVLANPPVESDGHVDPDTLLDRLGVDIRTVGPLIVILVLHGTLAKKFFLIDPRGAIIGSSSSADIVFPDSKMSPFHCRIFFDMQLHRWVLEDLESQNGTTLRWFSGNISCGDVFVAGSSLVHVSGQCSKAKSQGGFLRRFFGAGSNSAE